MLRVLISFLLFGDCHMRKSKALLMCLSVAMLTACHKQTPEEIFEEDATGVVMILHKYCYEITFGDGQAVLYISGLDENGNFENLSEDPQADPEIWNYAFGTGFFIDDEGTILTNRHVVKEEVELNDAMHGVKNMVDFLRYLETMELERLSNKYDSLEYEKENAYFYIEDMRFVNGNKVAEINALQHDLREEYAQRLASLEEMDPKLIVEGMRVRTISEIGIAYHDTHVTTEQDFLEKNPCVVLRVSDDEEVDLATIQLKDKVTPQGKHVFRTTNEHVDFGDKIKGLFKEDGNKELQMGQALYMIGFNAGITLAHTKQGVLAQFTTGNVTQHPDGRRVLYSIPALPGSSGSPVLDENGRLVAVNFAKFGDNNSGDFNFGVPLERIKEFLK